MYKLKIYFAGSIRAGREYLDNQRQIIKILKRFGYVLTEHFGIADVESTEYAQGKTDREIWLEDVTWIQESNVVVAEISTPSMGVGYEIGYAVSQGKKVLCLLNVNAAVKSSAMLSGSPDVTVQTYSTVAEAEAHIQKFLMEEIIPFA